MAFTVLMIAAVAALVTSHCTAVHLTNVQSGEVETEDGSFQDVRESDPSCSMLRETTHFNGSESVVVNDFVNKLVLVKFSEEPGVCHFRALTDEELRVRCGGEFVQSSEDPSEEREVRYNVVADLDVKSLPLRLTKGNDCKVAKLLVPVSTSDVSNHRKRRQAVTPAGCVRYNVYYTRCTLIPGTCNVVTNKCTYLCITYVVGVIYCPK